MTMLVALAPCSTQVMAQSILGSTAGAFRAAQRDSGGDLAVATRATKDPASAAKGFSAPEAMSLGDSPATDDALPSAPEPAGLGGNPQREGVPYAADWHTGPFSRIGIGADVSPLGIGIKGAVILDEYFDARLDMNFFGYTSNKVEIDGVNASGNLHLASGAAKIDLYPKNSIWRLTAGLMLFDGNRATASLSVVPGTSFTLNNVTYYSSKADPMTANGMLQFDSIKPAPLASFGFGRFIPRSNRHWSMPTEFGVIYEGAPALTVNVAGAVCTDVKQTTCAEVSDTSTPVGQAFNTNLQAALTKWRKDFDKVKLYPIFSYSVVYSFNIR
jgi:hypothetical protein